MTKLIFFTIDVLGNVKAAEEEWEIIRYAKENIRPKVYAVEAQVFTAVREYGSWTLIPEMGERDG